MAGTPREYRLSDFDFDLPHERIAQSPAAERSASRLLVVHDHLLDDRTFGELPSLLDPRDLVVFNDTRVIPARLHGTKDSGGRIELLIERPFGGTEVVAQARASHPPRAGGLIAVGEYRLRVLDRDERFVRLRLEDGKTLDDLLDAHGEVPLPPYITHPPDDTDAVRYQTVYAKNPGAVAAPTAGLHFDAPTLAALAARAIESAFVTLHVGAGTFLPVQSEDLSAHRMHAEWFDVPPETADSIDRTRQRGGRVIAVGTTTLRALESAAVDGRVQAGPRETRLFITPGFRFQVVDLLLTNFHLPKSTLLMLVSAFAGYDEIRTAYAHAISQRYRFFSYGDAMLIEKHTLS
jgi:S-adenosylmethionine:tRNA ribosyltransferase-isomerase